MHQCTLIHWGNVEREEISTDLIHKENPHIKLTWRTIEQLRIKPTYPEGILDTITSDQRQNVSHIIVRKAYT
ncbi:hypothetical protein GCM10008025_02360 [Ornithinibacillus halotolerans]|uniref:Uncharacterized protein n=1 Tax=Ornithinibacillus halotolerans TaxID=1274357 RepID=A0A916W316_9BACI|nr:hypothetical protein GCM10008025_02360 [Ornithinibacillus halotolerans]